MCPAIQRRLDRQYKDNDKTDMKRGLLTLLLLALPVQALDQESLFNARLEVFEHPNNALRLADQVLADDSAGTLAFQAALLKGWAILANNSDKGVMDAVLVELKRLSSDSTDPLQKADYAFLRANVAMGRDRFNQALPLLEEAMSYCRPFNQLHAYQYCSEITANAANAYAFNGDLERARSLINDSYRFAKLGARNNIYLDLKLLEAALARRQNEPAKALTLLKEAELEAQQLGEKRHQARAMSRQGVIYMSLGQYQQSEQLLMDALGIFESIQADGDITACFRYLGELMVASGRPELAIVQFYNALDIAKRNKDKVTTGRMMLDLGQAYRIIGKLDKSETLLKQAQTLLEEAQAGLYLPKVHYQLAQLYLAKKQQDKAITALQQALAGIHANPTVERDLQHQTISALIDIYEQKQQYHQALSLAKELAGLNQLPQFPEQVTVQVVAPPTVPPPKTQGLSPYWLALAGALGLGLGLLGPLWAIKRQRRNKGKGRNQRHQHPATGFLNINAFFKEGDNLLAELRLAMDLGNLSANQAHQQPLAAVMCYLPGMALAYETLGFQASRQALGDFADKLTQALPEARLLVQPSRDYLLFVLPGPGPGREEGLTQRLRQVIAQAAEGTALEMDEVTFAGTLLPLLPYHPRVGTSMTVLETLLFALSLACVEGPHTDLWLIGQSCTLPSALAEPIRASLSEAIHNGTIKVVGLSYGELMQRMQRLTARQEAFGVRLPESTEVLPVS